MYARQILKWIGVLALQQLINGDDESCAYLTNRAVCSSLNNLENFLYSFEDSPYTLESVTIDYSTLDYLSPDIFEELPACKYLELNNNDIKNLPARLFEELTKLEILKIFQNTIENLDNMVFSGASNIRELTLKSNKINLSKDLFDELQSLEEIYLDGSNLDNIEFNAFKYSNSSGLSSLRMLSLGDNNLTVLKDNSFSALNSLKKLLLRGNLISDISSKAFEGLSSLGFLDLSENNLKNLEGVFQFTPNLNVLLLMKTKIENLNSLSFKGLQNLKLLCLANNQLLSTIEPDTFDYLKKENYLETVILHKNGAKPLPPGIFQSFQPLTEFYLTVDDYKALESQINFDTPNYNTELELLNKETNPVVIIIA